MAVEDTVSNIPRGRQTQVLAFDGRLRGSEEVESYRTVVASVKCAIKDLLDDIVDDVVEEVVPGEAEEEVLDQDMTRMSNFVTQRRGTQRVNEEYLRG